MTSSFTIPALLAMFGTMVLLALLPSVSVLTITARSATSGFRHGVAVTVGVLLGDILFIIIAVYGLSLLADQLGRYFVLVKYLGAAYLLWLGIVLWRTKTSRIKSDNRFDTSLYSSFLTGLLVTLADQKAILFYLGFFPAYFDMSTITIIDTGIIILIATMAISTKLVYAFTADRASLFVQNPAIITGLNRLAGSIIIIVGVFLVIKA